MRTTPLWIRCTSIATLTFVISVLTGPGNVLADSPPPGVFRPGGTSSSVTIDVTSRQDGVWVRITSQQTLSGGTGSSETTGAAAPNEIAPATSLGASTDSASGRTWSDWAGIHEITPDGHIIEIVPQVTPVADWPAPWDRAAAAQHPNDSPYLLLVDGNYGGLVWLPPGAVHLGTPGTNQVAATTPTIDPRQVALELLRHITLPDLQIDVNPSLGLSGMSSWFWIQGYDGDAIGDSVNLSGVTVSVRVVPVHYVWQFGDGTTLDSHSLGQPYPAESDIRHTYEYSSLHFPAGFPVGLTVEFAAEYRVNGGTPQSLPSIQQTFTTSYRVQEAQSLLTGP